MAILLIDAGNTCIKWALSASRDSTVSMLTPGDWLQQGAVMHAEMARLPTLWHGLKVSRILISNVAGAVVRERLQTLLTASFGAETVPVWFASVAQLAGIRNAYRDPAQLGCDRFAAAIGAWRLFPQQALMVVNCGTATTIDVVSADGVFAGGLILPGLRLMATSLAHNTAQLPDTAGQIVLTDDFADNTGDAIISGCINAQVGAIERAAQHQSLHCVLSGGAAARIAPFLSIPHDCIDNLVLLGLQAVTVHPETTIELA